MNILTIVSGIKRFQVSNGEVLQLELKLNLTDKATEYSHIGDYLYSFYTKEGYKEQPSNILTVLSTEYSLLYDLHHTSYQEVWRKNLIPKS